MVVTLVSALVLLVELYLVVGLLFALGFVVRGVGRIDPVAAGGTWGFRIAILPGCVVLWPLLARRWRHGTAAPEERTPHRIAATAKGDARS